MTKWHLTGIVASFILAFSEIGCSPSKSVSRSSSVDHASESRAKLTDALVYGASGQKTSKYIAISKNETDLLQLTVTRDTRPINSIIDALSSSGYTLSGELAISLKQPNGSVTVRRIPITGIVATDGVPSTITIPSSVIGVPDLELGCFFDKSLNLELFGDNDRPYPHLMHLVQ